MLLCNLIPHRAMVLCIVYVYDMYMYKLSCPNTVERKLEHAQQLVDQLTSKSADLNWKVNDAEKDVGDLKCGFGTLKDDVAVSKTTWLSWRVHDLN